MGGGWRGAMAIPGLAITITALAQSPPGPLRGLAVAAACLTAAAVTGRDPRDPEDRT